MYVSIKDKDYLLTGGSSRPQMSSFLWYEPTSLLQQIADSPETPELLDPNLFGSIPSAKFRQWVSETLFKVQLPRNVVIMALLFMYRLKLLNPLLTPKPDSEFRPFAVAFMLGNKVMDDKRYSNPLWSKATGISLPEINTMEVEFLKSVRYGLKVSVEEWAAWCRTLRRFGAALAVRLTG
ncbi:hypothetical protein RUND412_000287 [Rhizina undulata]